VATRTTLKIMNKHLFEIPNDAVTAVVTMRKESGEIISGIAKGEPHFTESLALSFGVFVAMVQAIERMDGPEVAVMKDLRKVIGMESLERSREILTNVAEATRTFLDEKEENE
jgi:hypothetical protein